MMKTNSDAARTKLARRVIATPKSLPLPPMVQLTEDELRYYREIAQEMALAELTAHNRNLLALLAQAMVRIEQETAALSIEGTVITAPTGRLMPNPRRANIQADILAVEKLRRILALSNNPGMPMTEAVRKRQRIKKQEAEIRSVWNDDLIAMPDEAPIAKNVN